MKAVKCILNIIKKIEYVLLIAIFIVIVITTFLQVIGRYTPLPFSGMFEEIATFSFVWATMIGAGTCVREGGHMSMDFIASFMPNSKKVLVKLWSDIVAAIVGGGIIYASSQLIPKIKRAGMTSGSMQLPLWIQNLAVPVGAALICLWAIVGIVEDIHEITVSRRLPDGPQE